MTDQPKQIETWRDRFRNQFNFPIVSGDLMGGPEGELNGELEAFIASERIKLLEEVRVKVIGEDEENKKPFETSQDMFVEVRNQLRAEQRKALKTLEENL